MAKSLEDVFIILFVGFLLSLLYIRILIILLNISDFRIALQCLFRNPRLFFNIFVSYMINASNFTIGVAKQFSPPMADLPDEVIKKFLRAYSAYDTVLNRTRHQFQLRLAAVRILWFTKQFSKAANIHLYQRYHYRKRLMNIMKYLRDKQRYEKEVLGSNVKVDESNDAETSPMVIPKIVDQEIQKQLETGV